ncbi:hypothetical protein PBY51_005573 [Eleginops maclovinus]|uniref:Uncharacterized protein n=1 Tax=Eleginops maclovinus TaxID=56733 RepID=A0AAN8AHK1_ELEMC|nr:hypothetical protein PBY51_005573 [Eleginops maclovinus]
MRTPGNSSLLRSRSCSSEWTLSGRMDEHHLKPAKLIISIQGRSVFAQKRSFIKWPESTVRECTQSYSSLTF